MDVRVGNPQAIYLTAAGLLVVALAIWSAVSRRRAIRRFATSSLLTRLVPGSTRWRGVTRTALIVVIIGLLSLALMDIRWGKTRRPVPQRGIELMFALDVSRSMLARDASPNRLDRAKQQIRDMIDEMTGDRIGLVVFAGEAKQSVPLTRHYEDFKQVLDSVGPDSVRRGGTRLGEAIRTAADGFLDKTNGHRALVLFTDGEDQESKPAELAERLHAETGLRIFTVGLGDMDQGARIPASDSEQKRFVEYEGQQVWSRLNGQVLQAIATRSQGAYIPAGTKRVNMANVYHGYIARVAPKEFETAEIEAYIPRFQIFAAPALLLLLLEIWVSTSYPRANRTTARPEQSSAVSRTRSGSGVTQKPATTAAATLVLCIGLTPTVAGQVNESAARRINEATALLRENRTTEAIEAFSRIAEVDGVLRDRLNFNLGVAHYRNGDFTAALSLFLESAGSDDTTVAADSRYNLGNCHYSEALQNFETNPQAAAEALGKAITSYRSSLRLQPENADARANIELAMQMLNRLQQRQPQPNAEQRQQDQQSPQASPEQKSPPHEEPPSQEERNSSESPSGEPSSADPTSGEETPSGEEQASGEETTHAEEPPSGQQKASGSSQANPPDGAAGEPSESTPSQSPDGTSGNQAEDEMSDASRQSEPSSPPDSTESKGESALDQPAGQSSPEGTRPKESQAGEASESSADAAESETIPSADEGRQDTNVGRDRALPPDDRRSNRGSARADRQSQLGSTETPQTSPPNDEQTGPLPEGELSTVTQQPAGGSTDRRQVAIDSRADNGAMTRQEALKLLQSVRDRDMLRRLQQQRNRRARRIAVEKDW